MDASGFTLSANSEMSIFFVIENNDVVGNGLSQIVLGVAGSALLRVRRITYEYETDYRGGGTNLTAAGAAINNIPLIISYIVDNSNNQLRSYINGALTITDASLSSHAAINGTLTMGISLVILGIGLDLWVN